MSDESRSGEELKRRAAVAAADWVEEDMVVGLGTGSTVRFLLEEIARRRSEGQLRRIRCVPTSLHTAERAGILGIPLTRLSETPEVDVTIDGADEVDPDLNLVKGLGGALLREKIVAAASTTMVVIVDESKLVSRLGTRAPLPVEVDPFGAMIQPPFLRSLGAEPELRMAHGVALVTDGGNHIFDCRFPEGISDPAALESTLNNRPGVVENGLFIGMADRVMVAGVDGVRVLSRAHRNAAAV